MKKFLLLSILAVIAISCEDDNDDHEPVRPNVIFEDGGRTAAERGDEIEVVFTVRIGTNITSISFGDEEVTDFDPGAFEQEITRNFTVPENAPVEQTLPIIIVVEDVLGRRLEKPYSVNVTKTMIPFPAAVIDTDTKLDSSFNYLVTENVTVTNGATLTLPAWTNIVFSSDTATTGGFLEMEIDAGARLEAIGTPELPVVFTYDGALAGSGTAGQWARLKINGSPGMSSGTLRYVRIEYSGEDGAGLRMDDVDASTEVEFVQIYRSASLGMELRGGTVNLKHMVFTDNAWANIEYDNGDTDYSGFGQFFVLENSAFLVKENANGDVFREFESRDDADVTVSNVTIIGPGVDEDGGVDGVRIRNDAGPTKFYNSIIADFPDDGFRLDVANAITGLDGDYVVAHSYFFQIDDAATRDGGGDPLAFETQAATYSNVISPGETPDAAEGIEAGSFVPDSTIVSGFDPATLNPFFDSAPYVGAVGGTDWTEGWTRE